MFSYWDVNLVFLRAVPDELLLSVILILSSLYRLLIHLVTDGCVYDCQYGIKNVTENLERPQEAINPTLMYGTSANSLV